MSETCDDHYPHARPHKWYDGTAIRFCSGVAGLADITAGAADREQTPAQPDDLDRLRARRDAEVLRAAADDSPYATEADRFWRAWLRERADHIEGEWL